MFARLSARKSGPLNPFWRKKGPTYQDAAIVHSLVSRASTELVFRDMGSRLKEVLSMSFFNWPQLLLLDRCSPPNSSVSRPSVKAEEDLKRHPQAPHFTLQTSSLLSHQNTFSGRAFVITTDFRLQILHTLTGVVSMKTPPILQGHVQSPPLPGSQSWLPYPERAFPLLTNACCLSNTYHTNPVLPVGAHLPSHTVSWPKFWVHCHLLYSTHLSTQFSRNLLQWLIKNID